MTGTCSFHLEINETDFSIALSIAEFATELEERKRNFAPEVQAMATACAQKMHDLAIVLAGDRADEIYAPDEDQPQTLDIFAVKYAEPEEECHL